MSTGLLEVRNVTQRFDNRAILNDLSLDFWGGHIHAVIGPNGAGKSTLANTIMGLEGYANHDGDILLDGQSLKGISITERAKRGITLAWQEPARYEGLSVLRFITAGAKVKTVARAGDVLSLFGLDPDRYLSRSVDKTLSGGERKRIELASILAMEPRIVIMDEPDSGIDVEALQRIFDALVQFKMAGATVIMITHSMTVLKQADHAFLMCCGKLLDKGNVDGIAQYFGSKCLPCDHINQPSAEEIS